MSETLKGKKHETAPGGRVPVEIPDGAKKFIPFDEEGGVERFGIAEIHSGKIGDFEGSIFKEGAREGLILHYQPGNVRVYVERLDLTAREIDEIGTVSAKILENLITRNFFSEVKKNTDKLEEHIASWITIMEAAEEGGTGDEITTRITTRLGVILEDIKAAEPKLEADFAQIVMQLHGLRVVMINHSVLASGYHSLPIKLAFNKMQKR